MKSLVSCSDSQLCTREEENTSPLTFMLSFVHNLNEYWFKKRTNQQNAQINFGLINLLLFNHSNMFRPLNRSHHQGVQNP